MKNGGQPLVVLIVLAALFIAIQNFAGMGTAFLLGLDPKAGLMAGSISLTGGMGTTLAWAPIFVEQHGISNALEIGIAANTVGLIAACVIGGPIATFLIKRDAIPYSADPDLDIGASHTKSQMRMDYFCILWAMLALNLTVMLGMGLHRSIEAAGMTLPAFVSCLLAGILIRNLTPLAVGNKLHRIWPGIGDGLALISDLSLGLFLTTALMGLRLWELQGVFLFIVTVLVVQVLLTVVYIVFVVFPAMATNCVYKNALRLEVSLHKKRVCGHPVPPDATTNSSGGSCDGTQTLCPTVPLSDRVCQSHFAASDPYHPRRHSARLLLGPSARSSHELGRQSRELA